MKSKGKKRGFTIVELLVVMSIIIILIAMLVPSLNAVRRFAKKVTQKGQFHDISTALEAFSASRPEEGYPDSSALDLDGDSYCGAMKLCEAMVGQDGLGLHQSSKFDDMGVGVDGNNLYFNRMPGPDMTNPDHVANLRNREKSLEGQDAQIASMDDLFPSGQPTFDVNCAVLCDVYKRSDLKKADGTKLGMPVLYYKADPSKLTHDANDGVTNNTNIYSYWDNHELVELPMLWGAHPMYAADGKSKPFYRNTRDPSVTVMDKPQNPQSFILISAGFDGLYGTRDDVFNFPE